MNILYILHRSSIKDGATRSFLAMLELIINFGVAPLVVIPEDGPICNNLKILGVKYKICKCRVSTYPKIVDIKGALLFIPIIIYRLMMNRLARHILKTICFENEIQLIHTNVGTIHQGHHVAKKLKIPHVWHIREYQNLDFNLDPFPSLRNFKLKLKNTNNHLISITDGLKNHFSMHENARVIYDGVTSIVKPIFKKSKENYFLYVGRLHQGKGIEDLIYAFMEFYNSFCKEYKLLILGDTEESNYKEHIRKIVYDGEMEDKIIFLGFRDDVASFMSVATALVVPSKHEGFGMITAEAMVNGCLVIGNNTGGTKEILEKEQLGILYSGHDELVDSMNSVFRNGIEYYYPVIQKAQRKAIASYSYEQNAQKIYNYYIEILESY